MAKKKKKGAGAQDTDAMSKSELKAYHKEICEFYLENGWRDTLSYFALSPAQGSEIIPAKTRAQHKEMEKEAKRQARASGKGKKKSKGKKAKAKKESKRKASKKKAKTKAKKAAASAPADAPKAKKRRKKSKRKTTTRAATSVKAAEPDTVLDFLLSYRKKNGAAMIDDVIIELVEQQRKAA